MTESSRGTRDPLERALGLASDALGRRPAGLLTDFDGTLAPIVTDPGLARLADGADDPLRQLARRLDVVAIVTGRAPLEARQMVGLPELLVVGNHGTEWLEPGEATPRFAGDAGAVAAAIAAALGRVPADAGVTVEDKGASATVHYRAAPDPEATRQAIVRALGSLDGSELVLREGRMSLELRPARAGDKGTAVRDIIERFGLRGLVVMGDDLTDLDMFRTVTGLRAAGRIAAAIVGVGAAERVPQVAEEADVVLDDPLQVAALLAGLAGAVSRRPRRGPPAGGAATR